MTEDDENYWRYKRLGPLDQGRVCDRLAEVAVRSLPAEELPSRWALGSPEDFVVRYGGGPRWSRATGSQLFLVNGFPLFRIWTNANAAYALVDLQDSLKNHMERADASLRFFSIPDGSLRKCKPFRYRFKASTTDHVVALVEAVRRVYGLRNA